MKDINECASNPCVNGASYVDMPGWFACQCAPNFIGWRCEIYAAGYNYTAGYNNYSSSMPFNTTGTCSSGLTEPGCSIGMFFVFSRVNCSFEPLLLQIWTSAPRTRAHTLTPLAWICQANKQKFADCYFRFFRLVHVCLSTTCERHRLHNISVFGQRQHMAYSVVHAYSLSSWLHWQEL